MKIEDILIEKKADILKRWIDLIAGTYSANTAAFLKNQKDQFSNPVGYTIAEGAAAILDMLIHGRPDEKASVFMERVIQMRAVQDFTPPQAVGFLFSLKKLLREALKRELRENDLYEDLLFLESRIDDLVLGAFESYMKYRENLSELKVREFKNMAFRLLEKANLISDIPEEGS